MTTVEDRTGLRLPRRVADELYHDTQSPQEIKDVRARVREIATSVVAPVPARIANGDERTDGFPREVFDALAAEGLFRIPFGTDVGGAGLAHPATATAVAVEGLAYFSNSVAAIFDVHCILAGSAVNQGSPEQRERWLRPLVNGELLGAFATSEPAASSDLSPAAVATHATRDGEGWVLNGRKRWITNSVVAGFIVVLAGTGDRLSTPIVPTESPGLTIGTPDRKLGNRGQITAGVILDDVRVGPESLLGVEGGGLKIALQTLTYGRIGIGAAGVGMAQAAFDHTAAHLATRSAFGGPPGRQAALAVPHGRSCHRARDRPDPLPEGGTAPGRRCALPRAGGGDGQVARHPPVRGHRPRRRAGLRWARVHRPARRRRPARTS